MQKRIITVKGLCVSIFNAIPGLEGKRTLIVRRIVEPSWIELWFKISNNQFDTNLWENITDSGKSFLAQAVHQSQVHCPDFEVALAKYSKGAFDRLKLLEGSILAGNINQELVNEFCAIMDKLSSAEMIPKIHANKLKKQIQRTHDFVNKTVQG